MEQPDVGSGRVVAGRVGGGVDGADLGDGDSGVQRGGFESASSVALAADSTLCAVGHECNWTALTLDLAAVSTGGLAEAFRDTAEGVKAANALESSAKLLFGSSGIYDALSFATGLGALPFALYGILSGPVHAKSCGKG